ncbi:MAG: tetratricopeptide repeat protein, partial [Terracidiphilus sp.]
ADLVAEARAGLAAAERDHPGNTRDLALALMLLVQRQRVARQLGPETRAYAERALQVAEAAEGRESMLYALALSARAKLDLSEDHPEAGRPQAEQALEIARRAAPGSVELAQVADALQKICWQLGDRPCALRAEEEAVAAIRSAPGDNVVYLASMLEDLAQVRLKVGDRPGARAAMLEAIAIAGRQTSPGAALPVLESNAGNYFIREGEIDQAVVHLNRALELSKAVYGEGSIQVGHATVSVAAGYRANRQLSQSAAAYEQALALYRKWYGPNHTATADVEDGYAQVLSAWGKLDQALSLSLHAHKSNREHFSLAVRVLPERQAIALTTWPGHPLDVALSIVAWRPEAGTAQVYQEEIRSRALVAEEMARRQASLNRENDPQVAALLDELDKERAAALKSSGATPSGAGLEGAYTDAIARMEKTERALAERSLAYRTGQRTETVALDDVRRHLPRQAVLVSYVRFRRYPAEAAGKETPPVPAYLAFVLHPDSERIRLFDLGDAGSIDKLVGQARASADTEAHSGGLGAVRNERLYRQTGEALRRRVWDPLRGELAGARLALVVADGNLNLIPFAGLPDGKGYLVEHSPVIHMLTSERDLVPAEDLRHKTGLLAIGSPSFGPAASLPPAELRDSPVGCDQFLGFEFHPLPGSAAELTDIGAAWRRWNGAEDSTLVTGAEATAERFLAEASRRRVLHVATHAFLLDARCGNGNPLLHS